MPILNIYRSLNNDKDGYGKTVYLDGLRVFREKSGRIKLAYETIETKKMREKGKDMGPISYIPQNSHPKISSMKCLKEKFKPKNILN